MDEQIEETFGKITKPVFDAPLIMHNSMELYKFRNRFAEVNFLVVYCNPSKHG